VGRALDVGDAPALQAWVTDAARELSGLDIVIAEGVAKVLICYLL
jgi:hypothetical protein